LPIGLQEVRAGDGAKIQGNNLRCNMSIFQNKSLRFNSKFFSFHLQLFTKTDFNYKFFFPGWKETKKLGQVQTLLSLQLNTKDGVSGSGLSYLLLGLVGSPIAGFLLSPTILVYQACIF
jgi:hypothetical protein